MLTGTDKVDLTAFPDAKLIEVFLALRERRNQAKADFTKQQRPLLDVMEKIQNILMDRMNKSQLENIGAESGTAYKSERSSARVVDKAAFMDFIQEGNWDFLDLKANAPTVVAFMKEHGAAPPGVKVVRDTTVNVRTK